MRGFTSILLTSLAVVLSGCGGSGSGTPATNPPPSYPTITGNWALTATSLVTKLNYQMGGYITNTGGSVSGTLHLLDSGCFTPTEDIPITGTESTTGAVSATSSAVSSQVVAISGTVASDTLSTGKYSITGGCGNGDNGTVTGFIAPSYSNTYSGTFLSVSKISISTAITTLQSGPDSDGLYHVSGTATFSGSPCFASGTIANSVVTGAYMAVTITANDGSSVVFGGYITDSTGKTISGDYQVTGGKCSGDYGTGSVSHS
jgi:hypothetical protein